MSEKFPPPVGRKEKVREEIEKIWREKNPPVTVVFDEIRKIKFKQYGFAVGTVTLPDGREVRVTSATKASGSFDITAEDLHKPKEAMLAPPLLRFKSIDYRDDKGNVVYTYRNPFALDPTFADKLATSGASAEEITDIFLTEVPEDDWFKKLEYPRRPEWKPEKNGGWVLVERDNRWIFVKGKKVRGTAFHDGLSGRSEDTSYSFEGWEEDKESALEPSPEIVAEGERANQEIRDYEEGRKKAKEENEAQFINHPVWKLFSRLPEEQQLQLFGKDKLRFEKEKNNPITVVKIITRGY